MAKGKPFIIVDLELFDRSMERLGRNLKNIEREVEKAITLATVQFAEETLSIAQGRAPIKTGDLRASGTVEDPIKDDGAVVVFAGFNKAYARIQDVGGVVKPVKAKALFIPLREGVFPVKDKALQKSLGFKFGEDFALAQEVTIKGNRYWSSTVEEQQATATKAIGARAFQILRSAAK